MSFCRSNTTYPENWLPRALTISRTAVPIVTSTRNCTVDSMLNFEEHVRPITGKPRKLLGLGLKIFGNRNCHLLFKNFQTYALSIISCLTSVCSKIYCKYLKRPIENPLRNFWKILKDLKHYHSYWKRLESLHCLVTLNYIEYTDILLLQRTKFF